MFTGCNNGVCLQQMCKHDGVRENWNLQMNFLVFFRKA